jgi:cyanophycin synthetase
MQIGTGSRSRLLWEVSTDGDSFLASRLCADKWRTSRILRDAGLPGSVNTLVRSHEDAVSAAHAMGWPVLVKPSDQEQSAGVSVGIADDDALRTAFDHARMFSPNIIVEKQAPGLCYRLLVAGGELIYAVSRVPKSVVGDGVLTVSELIAKANEERMQQPPWKRIIAYPADAEAEQSLAAQGLDFDSIPEKDRRVLLRPITSGELGGWSDNLTDIIHPDNARLAIDAASVVGLTLAGVDLITTDLSRPWHETGAVVNEINFNPQFMTHGREKDARTLMAALVEGDGRIPVHLVTGRGDLQARAIQLRDKLVGEGRSCHITCASQSLDPSGHEIPMGFSGIFDRSLALAMRKDVSEIILYGQIDKVFARGLAVDRLERVYVCEPNRARGREMVRAIKLRVPHRSIRLIEG